MTNMNTMSDYSITFLSQLDVLSVFEMERRSVALFSQIIVAIDFVLPDVRDYGMSGKNNHTCSINRFGL